MTPTDDEFRSEFLRRIIVPLVKRGTAIWLMKRHGIALTGPFSSRNRFASLFLRTWRQVALWARRRILSHWRKVEDGLSDVAFPDIELAKDWPERQGGNDL